MRLSSDCGALLTALTDPAVRDLAWLLSAPPLLRAGSAGISQVRWDDAQYAAMTRWLRELDANPAALHAELMRVPQKRLGHYAEQLLAYFLVHGPLGRLIAANLPVRRGTQTLGECDFLLSSPQGRSVHWELAVKCYLHAGTRPDATAGDTRGRGSAQLAGAAAARAPYRALAAYVGPDLTDRFDRKLRHMLEHQLPLSLRPELAAYIEGGPWHAELFLKGWLFYPLQSGPDASPALAPDVLDVAHPRGWWASFERWQALRAELRAQGWRVLSRRAWMAPQHVGDPAPVLDDAALDALLARQFALSQAGTDRAECDGVQTPDPAAPPARRASPVLVAAMVRGDTGWHEASRGFIVDADWPDRALAFAALDQTEAARASA